MTFESTFKSFGGEFDVCNEDCRELLVTIWKNDLNLGVEAFYDQFLEDLDELVERDPVSSSVVMQDMFNYAPELRGVVAVYLPDLMRSTNDSEIHDKAFLMWVSILDDVDGTAPSARRSAYHAFTDGDSAEHTALIKKFGIDRYNTIANACNDYMTSTEQVEEIQ